MTERLERPLMQSVPTLATTHVYPAEELTAMRIIYGGKKCIITRNTDSVRWAHILEVLDINNPCVQRSFLFHITILNTEPLAPVDVGP